MNEALVINYNESALSTFFFGSGKINTEGLTSYLNTYLKDGFSIKAVQRESFIIFLEKKLDLID
jgi:hypothetical protein